jgi:HEAT repeat protein
MPFTRCGYITAMDERYEPTSPFLVDIANEDAPLTGSEFAEANLKRLIALTNDEDCSNRDWATFLLAQSGIETPETRNALIRAANDDDQDVRAEAIAGLAHRDHKLALPLVHAALQSKSVAAGIFEAAAEIGSPLLIEGLRRWSKPSDNAHLDALAANALAACEKCNSCSQGTPECKNEGQDEARR